MATEATKKFSRDYEATKALAETYDGMMSPLSFALFEAFFGLQREAGVRGNVIEFGVYRGRSASILLKHLRPDERAMLIDAKDTYPEFDKLKEVNPAFEFVKGKSEDLVDADAVLNFIASGIRFSHHDASHRYVNVEAEMKLMESHICPRGLMVLDDFGNKDYMQVVAACFSYLAQMSCSLELFLYASNKAYLCQRDDFAFYAGYVLNDLLPQLHATGMNVYLTRTENDKRYRGFSIAQKLRPTDPDRYGLNIFGDQFYRL